MRTFVDAAALVKVGSSETSDQFCQMTMSRSIAAFGLGVRRITLFSTVF